MCMIVDANRLSIFLATPEHEDAAPVHRWLRRGSGNLVYSTGGKFDSEIYRRAKVRLGSYAQAGRARFVPESNFREEIERLSETGVLRSDDAHVLALAKVSGARLLFTADSALQEDFKNGQIIKRPRGKIYSGAKNARLLTANACRRS